MGHPLCEQLRRIVDSLEKGDSAAAARMAQEMRDGLAGLPAQMEPSELAEAQALLQKYGELGSLLRERVIADMKRLGAAQHLRSYR